MKSDTKIGIFVVLLLVAVVVVLLGREVMNRKNKAAGEPVVALSDKPAAEGTDGAYSEDGAKPATDGIKDEVAGAPALPSSTPEGAKTAENKPLTFDPNAPADPARTGLEGTQASGGQPTPIGIATEVPPVRETPSEYVVKSGDSLERISKQVYGKRSLWHKLAEANPGVNPGNLKVGAKLVVPLAPVEAPRTAEASTSSPVPSPSGRTYTVKSGDSLERISKQVYGKRSLWHAIADANPGINPSRLKVGSVLNLPEGPTAPVTEAKPEKAPAKKTAKVDPWTQRGATRLVTSVETR